MFKINYLFIIGTVKFDYFAIHRVCNLICYGNGGFYFLRRHNLPSEKGKQIYVGKNKSEVRESCCRMESLYQPAGTLGGFPVELTATPARLYHQDAHWEAQWILTTRASLASLCLRKRRETSFTKFRLSQHVLISAAIMNGIYYLPSQWLRFKLNIPTTSLPGGCH